MTILLAILVFTALVLTHELGHFLFAKLFHVGVHEFSIGMGPLIFKKTGKPDENGIATDYSLRLLPLGGYVSMEGEDEGSESAGAFCNKPVWQRMIIVVAGATVNILTGILCTIILVLSMSRLGTTTIYVAPESAETSVFVDGDRILSVDGKRVHIDYDMRYTIMRRAVNPVDIVVMRDGAEVTLEDVTFSTTEEDGMTYADPNFIVYSEKSGFVTTMRHAYWRSVTSVRIIWESIVDLITGRVSTEAVTGPVGVAGAISDAAATGARTLCALVSLIALNLGMMNLFPFPALDGGRLVFLVIEAIRKKPAPKVEAAVNGIGLFLLFALMLVITGRDIFKLL